MIFDEQNRSQHDASSPSGSGAELQLLKSSRWYAVHTQPHAEETACLHLERQGFPTFLPRRMQTVRHARRIMVVKRAYFPGYLFISLNIAFDRWRSVNSTVGVQHLLCAGDRPLPIKEGLIEALQAATGPDRVLRSNDIFKHGQKVRITCGAFAEQIGVVDKVKNSEVLRILLTMMDRQVPLFVSRDNLAVN